MHDCMCCFVIYYKGISRVGGAPGARPPKIGKKWFFLRKIVIFHTKYPKMFAPPSARRNFFKCPLPPNLKFWIRPCTIVDFKSSLELVLYVCFISTLNKTSNLKKTQKLVQHLGVNKLTVITVIHWTHIKLSKISRYIYSDTHFYQLLNNDK